MLLEPTPAAVAEKIRRHLLPGEEELIRVAVDLSANGTFGSQWVVVTGDRILIVPAGGEDSVSALSLRNVSIVKTEAVVGGGYLEVAPTCGPPLRVPYSASLSERFAEVARGIDQLRQGRPVLSLGEPERLRCEKCRRLLPEKDGICPACIRRLAVLRRVTTYLKPYQSRVALLALASLVMTFASLLPPMITRAIVDEVLVPQAADSRSLEERFGRLVLLVLGLFLVRALGWAGEWVHGWWVTWLGARVTADIRSQLYRKLEMLSLRFYDKHAVGSLMARVTNDAGTLEHFLIRGLPHLIINALTFLGILALMFWMSSQLALAVLLPVPAIWAWGVLFWRRMSPLLHRGSEAGAKFSAQLSEVLAGIRVVKAFAQERREITRFERRNADLLRVNVQTNRNRAILLATMALVTSFGVLTLWFFGGMAVISGGLTLGTLLAFYGYVWLLYGPLQWFGQINSWMTQAVAGAGRIFEVLDTRPEPYDDPQAGPMPRRVGRVSFHDVTFGYDRGKPVLHQVELEVRPGKLVGLVGRSGAGKTTLMNLLCRFYDVDQGEIAIDGVDIRRIRLEELREQMGVVLQEPFLFSGTIAENIRYGRPGASFPEIVEAARAANAHAFILSKPDGYDTEVGEGGHKLSGGERQRIAIARAILRDPQILILDEATSSLDAESERLIQEALGRLAAQRTTFVIAHRLSTVRAAAHLVVLEGGRVAEVGTYDELMARHRVFYHLVRFQQEAAGTVAIGA